jgi:hypothetical protein
MGEGPGLALLEFECIAAGAPQDVVFRSDTPTLARVAHFEFDCCQEFGIQDVVVLPEIRESSGSIPQQCYACTADD